MGSMRYTRADLDKSDTFVCVGCKRRVPPSFGCDDNMPEHCDDCWNDARIGKTVGLGPANDRGVPADELQLAALIAVNAHFIGAFSYPNQVDEHIDGIADASAWLPPSTHRAEAMRQRAGRR